MTVDGPIFPWHCKQSYGSFYFMIIGSSCLMEVCRIMRRWMILIASSAHCTDFFFVLRCRRPKATSTSVYSSPFSYSRRNKDANFKQSRRQLWGTGVWSTCPLENLHMHTNFVIVARSYQQRLLNATATEIQDWYFETHRTVFIAARYSVLLYITVNVYFYSLL